MLYGSFHNRHILNMTFYTVKAGKQIHLKQERTYISYLAVKQIP